MVERKTTEYPARIEGVKTGPLSRRSAPAECPTTAAAATRLTRSPLTGVHSSHPVVAARYYNTPGRPPIPGGGGGPVSDSGPDESQRVNADPLVDTTEPSTRLVTVPVQ